MATFASLSAPWERARTERLLVVALDRLGRTDDAAAVAVASAETLHALRAVDDAVVDRALAALA